MPEFISKLQHKYYEKGEFSDEKARGVEETIELIKSFPWNEERGTDIQLTGPSVCIEDNNGNYLKVGLYFNGKYCVYYLDIDGHLYEFHTPDLNEACDIVTKFFGGEIALQTFEKHFFSVGSGSHFRTASFRYTIDSAAMLISLLLTSIFMVLFTGVGFFIFFIKPILWPVTILYSAGGYFALQRTYFSFRIYLKSTDMFINISSGSATFQFGIDNDYKTYNKSDVLKLMVYGRGKVSRIFDLTEIVFVDDSSLFVPGMLIGDMYLSPKFRNVKTEYVTGYFKQNQALKKAGE